MNLLVSFIIAFILSALSSLPTGLITLNIMQRAIESSKKAAIMMALGSTLPEFVYTYIALYGFDFFNDNISIGQDIQITATIIFFLLAVYFLTKKSEKPNLTPSKKDDYFNFGRGFLVAAMNILVIPFWIFIALWLQTYGFSFVTSAEIIFFSIGSALGALLIFLAYAELGHLIFQKLGTIVRYTNKAIGISFLLLGIYQITQFI